MPRPIHITSLDDPRVAVFRDVRDRDLRGRDDLFMAESELILQRLIRTPERIASIFLSTQKWARLEADLQRALPDTLSVYVAELGLMSSIAGFHVHRGVLTVGRRPNATETSLDSALGHLRDREDVTLVIAEGLTNVDNMGSMFRNAAAFGVDGILLDPTCCDPLYRKAIRVSMGHVLAVPYAISTNWPDDLVCLRTEWNTTIIAAEVTAASVPIWDVPRSARRALLIGAEGPGVTPEALEHCAAVAAIPMAPGVPSLNVAVALGCMLYEFRRGDRVQSVVSEEGSGNE